MNNIVEFVKVALWSYMAAIVITLAAVVPYKVINFFSGAIDAVGLTIVFDFIVVIVFCFIAQKREENKRRREYYNADGGVV